MLLAPLKHDPYKAREEGNKGLIVGKDNEDVGYDEKEPASNNREALVLALTVVAVLVVVWTSTH